MKLSVAAEIPLSGSAQELLSAAHHQRAQASLKLLGELEQSLKDGETALLALDVDAMERQTAEQQRLAQSLEILLLPKDAALRRPGTGPETRLLPQSAPALDAALRMAAVRVLYRSRVQASLLGRAQRFLAVLYNLTAGPGATYGALLSRMNEIAGPADRSETREKLPCRV